MITGTGNMGHKGDINCTTSFSGSQNPHFNVFEKENAGINTDYFQIPAHNKYHTIKLATTGWSNEEMKEASRRLMNRSSGDYLIWNDVNITRKCSGAQVSFSDTLDNSFLSYHLIRTSIKLAAALDYMVECSESGVFNADNDEVRETMKHHVSMVMEKIKSYDDALRKIRNRIYSKSRNEVELERLIEDEEMRWRRFMTNDWKLHFEKPVWWHYMEAMCEMRANSYL